TFYPLLLIYLFFVFWVLQLKKESIENVKLRVGSIIPVSFLLMLYLSINYLFKINELSVLLRFTFEVIGNLGCVLIGYWFVKRYDLNYFTKILLWASLFIIILIINIFTELESIRRIGTGGANTNLAVAVNHIGHALAFTVICGLYQIKRMLSERKYFKSIILSVYTFLLVFVTFLTGSRAAILGLLLSFIFGLIYLRAGRIKFIKKFTVINIIGITFLSLLSMIALFGERIGSLLRRFEFDMILIGAQNRIDVFFVAIESASDWALFFGNPWAYQPLQSVNPIVYPHNWFLTIALHLGIFFSIIFLMYLVLIIYTVFKSRIIDKVDKWMLLSCLMIVMVYVLTSGRLTRVITIFVLLGVCWGAASTFRSSFWPLKKITHN
ncbi:MAG: hypothetical protein WD607_07020, partial [Candidatus Paceibacterota bacterium]